MWAVPPWTGILELLVAFALSTAIGIERELRQKSAGLRTHTLVGLGTAVFVETSKYGFADVLPPNHPGYDPSRIAAQIVSGIGFLGAGLIFVRRDAVRGLTTAAGVWVTCAVAMACAAGLAWLGVAATALYLLVAFAYTPVGRLLNGPDTRAFELTLTYQAARGVLPTVLVACTAAGFRVADAEIHRTAAGLPGQAPRPTPRARARCPRPSTTVLNLAVEGPGDPHALLAQLSELHGVLAVTAEARTG
ncbi:MgtC/SapB family protein [Streptomycetaceae bacterium NBC_01309]